MTVQLLSIVHLPMTMSGLNCLVLNSGHFGISMATCKPQLAYQQRISPLRLEGVPIGASNNFDNKVGLSGIAEVSRVATEDKGWEIQAKNAVPPGVLVLHEEPYAARVENSKCIFGKILDQTWVEGTSFLKFVLHIHWTILKAIAEVEPIEALSLFSFICSIEKERKEYY
eukprot:Gb_38861 [translate_table: standard]